MKHKLFAVLVALSLAACLAVPTFAAEAADTAAEGAVQPRAAFCGNCGNATMFLKNLGIAPGTPPSSSACTHKPYGLDYFYTYYVTYQYQCSICQYASPPWSQVDHTEMVCDGRLTPPHA